MKELKVISFRNLPARTPIWNSLTAAMALDYWNAPEWLMGAVGLFFIVVWILLLVKMDRQKQVDVFKNPK